MKYSITITTQDSNLKGMEFIIPQNQTIVTKRDMDAKQALEFIKRFDEIYRCDINYANKNENITGSIYVSDIYTAEDQIKKIENGLYAPDQKVIKDKFGLREIINELKKNHSKELSPHLGYWKTIQINNQGWEARFWGGFNGEHIKNKTEFYLREINNVILELIEKNPNYDIYLDKYDTHSDVYYVYLSIIPK